MQQCTTSPKILLLLDTGNVIVRRACPSHECKSYLSVHAHVSIMFLYNMADQLLPVLHCRNQWCLIMTSLALMYMLQQHSHTMHTVQMEIWFWGLTQ